MYILDETTEKDNFVGDCPNCGNPLIVSPKEKILFECTECGYVMYNSGFRDTYNMYKRSALNAIIKLGDMNYKGQGTEQNYDEAFKLYKQAAELDEETTFRHGEKCYNTQEYDIAFYCFKALAEKNNLKAIIHLGDMYCKGQGTPQNFFEASGLYKQASKVDEKIIIEHGKENYKKQENDIAFCCFKILAENNNLESMLCLADMYFKGQGTQKDPNKALKIYKKVSEKNKEAIYNHAKVFYLKKEYEISFSCFKVLAEDGFLKAMLYLADMYFKGQGTQKDLDEGLKLYKDLSIINGDSTIYGQIQIFCQKCNYEVAFNCIKILLEEGNLEAIIYLGDKYCNGQEIHKNYDESYYLYKKAAEINAEELLNHAKTCYENYKYEIAFYSFKALAENDNLEAMLYLAKMYCEGKGTQQDYNEAYNLYKKGAEINAEELFNHGKACYKKHKYEIAFYCFKVLAENDNLKAILYLAYMHCEGKGTEQDYSKTYTLYKKASEINKETLFNHGKTYYEKHKYEIAFYCFKVLAENDNLEAMLYLADLYYKGQGTEKDYNETYNLFKKAAEINAEELLNHAKTCYENHKYVIAFYCFKVLAENDNLEAMLYLADLYYKGQGTEKDYNETYNLFKKAAEINAEELLNHAKTCYENYKYEIAYYSFKALAENDNLEAMFYLGDMYCEGTEKDYNETYNLFKKAAEINAEELLNHAKTCYENYKYEITYYSFKALAENDNLEAMLYLADMYCEGKGTEKDYNETYNLFKKAAEINVEELLNHAKTCYEKYKYEIAYYSFKALAENGNLEAMLYLADMYFKGQGTQKNLDEGLKLYKDLSIINGDSTIYGQIQIFCQKCNYEVAFNCIKILLEEGNLEAMLYLADMYCEGKGTEQDYIRAYDLYKKASEINKETLFNHGKACYEKHKYVIAFNCFKLLTGNDYLDAMLYLADMYCEGKGTEQDYIRAYDLYKKASEINKETLFNHGKACYEKHKYVIAFNCFKLLTGNDYLDATLYLADMYCEGEGTEQDYIRAYDLYKKASEINKETLFNHGKACYKKHKYVIAFNCFKLLTGNDYLDATLYLADMYCEGKGTEQDYIRAYDLYKKASEINKETLFNHGKACYEKHKYVIAFNCFKLLTGNDYLDAMLYLADMYCEGEGTEQNYIRAYDLYKKASEINKETLFNHGKACYEKNKYVIAFNCFKVLAENDNLEAMLYLADMYCEGKGTEKDYDEALKIYNRAVKFGDSNAIIKLGDMYCEGKGTEKDYNETYNLFKKAAEINAEELLNHAKTCYENYKYEIAFYSFKALAENDNLKAMLYLGDMYSKGQGTEQNYDEALKTYKRAVKFGDSNEMIKLGDMYYNGKGIEKNNVEAFSWYKKAAENGNYEAMKIINKMYQLGEIKLQDFNDAYNLYFIYKSKKIS